MNRKKIVKMERSDGTEKCQRGLCKEWKDETKKEARGKPGVGRRVTSNGGQGKAHGINRRELHKIVNRDCSGDLQNKSMRGKSLGLRLGVF